MPQPTPSERSRWAPLAAAAAIALAVVAVYVNSLSVPFVFDDPPSTVGNPTIRTLWPPWEALSPPHGRGITVEGRPVLNLSLAVSHAISGDDVWGYHALNVLIHLLGGLALFGIVRRTLERTDKDGPSSAPAFAVALLWSVHPLQTESVTYVVQRAESLMGLFYLLTLYCFIRSIPDGPRRRFPWAFLSAACCLLGMATKEVMVSAPLIVLLYDRTFAAGSLREAVRRRRRYYLCLAGTWIFLLGLVLSTGTRGGTAGFGIGVSPWTYAQTQFQAIAHYLKLAFWPHPLVFDYGVHWTRGAAEVAPYAALIGALAAATAVGLWKRSPAGFLGAWFFAILAPTSSIVPGNRQTLAEHRMYLPLAAVIVLAVCGGRALAAGSGRARRAGAGGVLLLLAATSVLGALSIRRNGDYRSILVLYRDTVAKRPGNAFARYNLGKLLDESGLPDEAMEQYRAAIRLDPGMAEAHYNLGNTLDALGRIPDAVAQYEAALRTDPNYAKARYNLGNAFHQLGRREEALEQFNDATLLQPDYAEARDNLGAVLLELGRVREAERQFREVLRIRPGMVETHFNLGNALLLQGRTAEAAEQYEAALKIEPGFAPALERLKDARERLDAARGL